MDQSKRFLMSGREQIFSINTIHGNNGVKKILKLQATDPGPAASKEGVFCLKVISSNVVLYLAAG
jgi:hypothetical protein